MQDFRAYEKMRCLPQRTQSTPRLLVFPLRGLGGATAAQALLGRLFKVTAHRGEPVASSRAPLVVASVHPSSLLRERDDAPRYREIERFVDDLRRVARTLRAPRER